MIIQINQTLHQTLLVSISDSAAIVYRVVQAALSRPTTYLTILVYYTGAGPADYRRASVAVFSLRKLLGHEGYDSTRLVYRAVSSPKPLREKKYPYRRIDFVVTPGLKLPSRLVRW